MSKQLFNNLVKLGNQNPDLRDNISTILHTIRRDKFAGKDLSDLKDVLRDIKKASFYDRASDLAVDILSDLRHTGVFLWDDEFDKKIENLLSAVLKESQNIMLVEDQRRSHEEHLEPLREMKEKFPKRYDKDYYHERKKENLKFRLKKTLRYLNGRSRYEPDPHIRGGTLLGTYRAENIPKEFSQQRDSQWERELERAKKELKKDLFPKYKEIVKDYSVRRGDKNYVDVQIQLK